MPFDNRIELLRIQQAGTRCRRRRRGVHCDDVVAERRAVEKAATTMGYTFTMFEEVWNYGFPQEMTHFVRCVQGKETPIETGEDGREVLKIIYAAYESAGTGRRIDWPYSPRKVGKPIDLWQG